MAADFYSILDNFKNFIGGRTGLFHWCLFCLAVVMLFFLGRKYQEEKQTVRFLVWPTILVLLFLFNPLFYRYVGSRFFAGVYWRLFWMLPVSFTAAYVVVWLVCRWKKQAVRIVVLVAALGTIALSGQKIYSKATFTEAENEYKLPQAALDRRHMMQLGHVLTNHPGYCEVKLAVMDAKGNAEVMTFGDRFRVKRDTSLFAEIKILFGPSCLPTA